VFSGKGKLRVALAGVGNTGQQHREVTGKKGSRGLDRRTAPGVLSLGKKSYIGTGGYISLLRGELHG